jgi:hypothetical protein
MKAFGRQVFGGTALLMAAGCAASGPPVPAAQTYSMPGKYRPGVVVDVRQVAMQPQAGSAAGLNEVLASLHVAAPAGPVMGREVVIRLDDGSATTVMEPPGLVNGFAAGDRVAIADGPQAGLVHKN